ncbi:MAG: hypothetical protein IPL42_02980 [Saprospiraceae bacterium]|nr:hypothetical protein [Saprospiraceae bacterium]
MESTNFKHIKNLEKALAFYKSIDFSDDDGDISQLKHALQTAYWAEQETTEVSLIFSAFIHNIGYFIPESLHKGKFSAIDHQKLGAEYLSRHGFNYHICTLVKLHTEAKRYLATTQPEYFDNITDIDVLTFDLQGGFMNQKEEERFLNNPLASQSIQLRVWIDRPWNSDLNTPDFKYYEDFFTQHVNDLMQ